MNNEKIEFLDRIKDGTSHLLSNHLVLQYSFDSSIKFYYLRDSISDYVLAIKQFDEYNIVKTRYNLSGVAVSQVLDTLLRSGNISRKYGNRQLLIKDNKIIDYK